MMKTLVNRYYYTLADLADVIREPEHVDFAPELANFWFNLLPDGYGDDIANFQELQDTNANSLWRNHIWPRFRESVFVYVDVESRPWWNVLASETPTNEEIQLACVKKIGQVYAWLKESNERYTPIIEALDNVKTKLLDQIESSAVSVYNDTPQVANDFENDPYATTSTRSKSKTEVATPIERFNEISKKMRSVYED